MTHVGHQIGNRVTGRCCPCTGHVCHSIENCNEIMTLLIIINNNPLGPLAVSFFFVVTVRLIAHTYTHEYSLYSLRLFTICNCNRYAKIKLQHTFDVNSIQLAHLLFMQIDRQSSTVVSVVTLQLFGKSEKEKC